tara:strand:+ start:96 stop:374 length:279 start_codon:yes stop_codon:yes gene_type:complete
LKKIHIVITGKVQGVGFRYWLYQIANEKNVHGWVKNKNTNEVEAILIGDADCVDSIIKLCEKGPSFSNVTNIKIQNYQQEYHKKSFDILNSS